MTEHTRPELVAQIRALKNSDPEGSDGLDDERTLGWNDAIDAVLELLPDETPAELPINKMMVPPYQRLDLPTDSGRVAVDNASPYVVDVIARRVS